MTKPTPELLRAFLAEHQLSQTELARHLGVADRTLSRWVLGHEKPSTPVILDLALKELGRMLKRRK